MKKVWTYFAIGCVLAIAGMFFSDICGNFFNGMDYGSACLLGMGCLLRHDFRSKDHFCRFLSFPAFRLPPRLSKLIP